jgi:hypothetical protein
VHRFAFKSSYGIPARIPSAKSKDAGAGNEEGYLVKKEGHKRGGSVVEREPKRILIQVPS